MRRAGTAGERDWIETVRQAAPRLLHVLDNLRPTFELDAIADLDAVFLGRHAIRGLIWDVDGTLTHRHDRAFAPEAAAAIRRLFALSGVRHVVLSNCGEARYQELAGLFPGVPILKGYRTPAGSVFRRLCEGADVWSGAVPAPSDAATLRAVRKPDPGLVHYAVRELALPPEHVAAVGDQYLTDIAGANMAGIRSIKVPTLGRSSFPPSVRALQRIDGWLRRLTA